jgi:hypothetical protein
MAVTVVGEYWEDDCGPPAPAAAAAVAPAAAVAAVVAAVAAVAAVAVVVVVAAAAAVVAAAVVVVAAAPSPNMHISTNATWHHLWPPPLHIELQYSLQHHPHISTYLTLCPMLPGKASLNRCVSLALAPPLPGICHWNMSVISSW